MTFLDGQWGFEHNEDCLARFDLYSSKVKSLIITGTVHIHPSVYIHISLWHPIPLPSLTKFSCFGKIISDEMMYFPSLTSASFFGPDTPGLLKYFSLVSENITPIPLQSLVIAYAKDHDGLFPPVSQLVTLRSFTLRIHRSYTDLDTLDLRPLYHLQHLEALTVDLRPTGISSRSTTILD
ncbi:hypothetical protein D9758_003518 [Tetrapyrgos nigripes]|uniref:Uncharacterized protein n=1 Tax=Tetrapyrgos nigripes TaxID=182062 RepID=A0A8H5LW20_9AGAR|nr:hypothetical protein D9758_003518 [Tetrapyrgos nigripes]